MNAKKFSPLVIAVGLPLVCPWFAVDLPLVVHIPQVIAFGLPLVVGISEVIAIGLPLICLWLSVFRRLLPLVCLWLSVFFPASLVIAVDLPLVCLWFAVGLPLIVPLLLALRKIPLPPHPQAFHFLNPFRPFLLNILLPLLFCLQKCALPPSSDEILADRSALRPTQPIPLFGR